MASSARRAASGGRISPPCRLEGRAVGAFHRSRGRVDARSWAGGETNAMRRDLRATGFLSAAILGSRVLGLVREVVFAALFGARAVADAYQVAFRIPNLLRDLLAEGALSSAFVPTFREVLTQEGEAAAYRLANLIFSALLVLTGTITLLGMFFAEEIVTVMARGFAGDASKVALAADLTRWMMPILSLVSLGAVWMGMLNAERRFVAPALGPAVFNVVSIATAVVVGAMKSSVEVAISVWAIGTLLAGVLQSGMQLVPLWRSGYRPKVLLRGLRHHPGVRRVGSLMAPAVIGVAAVQINVFVNTGFAGSLGDGAVSQLSYAFRLFFLPLGVFGVALGTVATTSVSEAAAEGDRSELAVRCGAALSAGWMLTSASALGLFVLADPLVTLIYRYGATTAQDAGQIAWCLRAYVVGLVPYSLIKIIAPSYYSVDRARVPLVASVAAVSVNITFNALTYRVLDAPGLALGTAVGAITNYAVLRGAYASRVSPLPREQNVRRVLALLLGNAALAVVLWGCWSGYLALVPTRDGVAPWLGRLQLAAAVVGTITAGAFVYLRVMRWLGYPDAEQLAALPGRVLAKLRRRSPERGDPNRS